MKFVIAISCDNAAFEDVRKAECLRIINNAVARVALGHTDGVCMDSNGNRVGEWYVEGLLTDE